jgi:DNA repair exonuclease SbcCD ATPase subunit
MDQTNPININISKDKETEKDPYSEFRDYIIKNNIELQHEIKTNLELIKTQEATIAEKEAEEDKYDTRIRYMKGLLQNLNELRNNYKKVAEKIEEKQKLVQDLHKKNKKNYDDIYKLLITINISTFIIPLYYVNYLVLIPQTCYIIGISYCYLKIKEKYMNIKSTSKETTSEFVSLTTHINILKKDITKTEESNISIDNWICEI